MVKNLLSNLKHPVLLRKNFRSSFETSSPKSIFSPAILTFQAEHTIFNNLSQPFLVLNKKYLASVY